MRFQNSFKSINTIIFCLTLSISPSFYGFPGFGKKPGRLNSADRSYLSQDEEQQTIANGKRMLDLYKDAVPQEREEPIARKQTAFDTEQVETKNEWLRTEEEGAEIRLHRLKRVQKKA